MSKVVDQQVVEMRFDNGQFERGVEQSTKSIEKLKNSLDFSGITSGLEDISSKLSPFGEMWRRVWSDVADVAFSSVSSILNATKALGTDQIFAGFAKYSQITKSTQTIMAATRQDWEDTGAQMEYVNEQLLKLAWFTDETSYSFTEMVSSIGKFTSSGIAPDDAVETMMGIATWAGISGASIEQANQAMYNLSQAMASGVIRAQDWSSIETANMATNEFKQLAIDTAVAMGKLQRSEDGWTYAIKESKKGVEYLTVSVDNFRTTLNKDYGSWFTKDVFVETAKMYGEFNEVLYASLNDLGEHTDMSTTEFIEHIDEYREQWIKVHDSLESEIGKISSLEGEELENIGLWSIRVMQLLEQSEDAISADELAENLGITVDQLNSYLDTFRGTILDVEYLQEEFDLDAESAKNFSEALRRLASDEMELGRAAFKASQESRTFEDSFMATQDALSSKWMLIYQTVLGDYMQSVELWSRVTDEMYDLFVTDVEGLYDVIREFGKLGGRDVLLESIENIWTVILSFISSAKEGFQSLFPELTGEGLLDATKALRDFTEKLAVLPEGIENTWLTFFDIVRAIKGGFEDAFPAVTKENIDGIIDRIRALTEEVSISDLKLLQIRTTITFIGQTAKNIWETVKTIFSSIYSAFEDIFPPQKSAVQIIYEIARGIKNLSKNIREFVEGNAEKLQSIFRGIFSVFDIFRQLLIAIISPFTGLKDTAGGLAQGILDVSASFGDWLTNLDKYIKENDVFGKAVQNVIDFFTELRNGIDSVVTALTGKNLGEIWELIKTNAGEAGKSIADFFGSFKSSDSDDAESTTSGLAAIFEKLNGWLESIKQAWADAKPYFDEFVDSLSESFEVDLHSWEDIQKAFREGGALAVIFLIIQALYDLYYWFDWFFSSAPVIMRDFIQNVAWTFESFMDIAEGIGDYIRVNIIKEMAKALLYLAVAIALIASIKTEKLKTAVAVMVLVFTELAGIFTILTHSSTTMDAAEIWAIGSSMKKIGWAILLIAASIKMIAKASDDPAMIWAASGALAGMMTIIGIMLGVLSKIGVSSSEMSGIASALLILGVSLILFSAAIAILVKVGDDKKKIEVAVQALLAMLGVIGVLMTQAKRINAGKVTALAGSLVIIGVALVVISAAIAIVASAASDPDAVKAAIIALGIMMGVILVFMGAADKLNPAKIVAVAGSLIIVGVALVIIASAIAIVANVPVENLKSGLGGMVALLIVTATILAALSYIKGNLIEGAAAITLAAIGLVFMAEALTKLSEIPDPIAVIAVFGACLLILVGLSVIAMKVAPGLYAIGVAMALIGIGALAAGEGALRFATAVEKLISLGTEGVDIWNYALEHIGELLPGFLAAFVDGVSLLITAFINMGPAILEAVVAWGAILLRAVIILLPLIREVLLQLFYTFRDLTVDFLPVLVDLITFVTREILRSMTTLTPEITAAAMFILVDTLTQIAANIFEITYLATDIALEITFAILNALIDHIPDFIETGINFVISLIDGLAAGIENNRDRFKESVKNLVNVLIETFCDLLGIHSPSQEFIDLTGNIIDGIVDGLTNVEKLKEISEALKDVKDKIVEPMRELIDGAVSWGKDIMGGLKQGLDSMVGAVSSTVESIANSVSDTFRNILGIQSPSKVFRSYGQYIDEGLSIGLIDGTDTVNDATEQVGKTAIDGISRAIIKIGDIVENGIDTEPTIRPVLDLSNVTNGIGVMNSMLSSNRSISIAGYDEMLLNNKMAERAKYAAILEGLRNPQTFIDPRGSNQTNVFNINGAKDPKAIADEVSSIIQNQVDRRNAVWA